mgnify:CR=1 FL=1
MRPNLIRIPEPYMEALRLLVVHGFYPNLSEAVRIAVRELIYKHGYFRISSKGKTSFVIMRLIE